MGSVCTCNRARISSVAKLVLLASTGNGKISFVLDPTLGIRLALAIYRRARRRIRLIGSTSWPMADGKVFSGAVQHDDLRGWVTELTYSYMAIGEYYSGTFYRAFTRKKNAEAFLERFPWQTPIPVRYKLEKPEVSTLLLSDLSLLLSGL